jgi:hypothetical protein
VKFLATSCPVLHAKSSQRLQQYAVRAATGGRALMDGEFAKTISGAIWRFKPESGSKHGRNAGAASPAIASSKGVSQLTAWAQWPL